MKRSKHWSHVIPSVSCHQRSDCSVLDELEAPQKLLYKNKERETGAQRHRDRERQWWDRERRWWDLVWMRRAWQNRFISVTVGNEGDCLQVCCNSHPVRCQLDFMLTSIFPLCFPLVGVLFLVTSFLVSCYCIFETTSLKTKRPKM